jgi:cytochrome b pre-mRNA-processing protein 3
MFRWFTGKSVPEQHAEALHAAIVEEARAPHLYATLKVPDTTDGRLEMLTLHMALVLDRVGRMGPAGAPLGLALNEAYVTAMDDAMRKIGVGDMVVPRKVKKAAGALYDRHRAYGPAIAASLAGGESEVQWHDTLAVVLGPVAGTADTDLRALAHYADSRVKTLAAVADDVILAGRLV